MSGDFPAVEPHRILVFIPCYNCERQIPRVLMQFDASTASHIAEVLVLDNGSRDGTVAAAIGASGRSVVPKVTIARNRSNYNLGGSHKAAFRYAVEQGYTHVLVLHGDDQGHIRDILPILDAGMHRNHDACLGARFMQGSRLVGYSSFRIFGNYVFNVLFSLATFRPVKDLGSGLNIFSRTVFADARIQGFADDLRFNIFLLLYMQYRSLRLCYFPIEWREDDQVSNVKMTSQAMKTLWLLLYSLVARKRFYMGEHREVVRDEYLFDVVHQQVMKS